MLDSEWEYTIECIESKRKNKPNKYRDIILGKKCIVPVDEIQPPCNMGRFICEEFGHHPSPRWFYTTEVIRCDVLNDGRVVLESQNSIYTFAPIKRGVSDGILGQRSDDSD